ncbi:MULTISPECIES: aldolase/citrate lyase family protein [unclassified Roseitalea]|uniref:HpcH/HpaI aldolase family protein n=1 Tax=unclassified Roseitalea TaxID=2639107 RepID=UPI00273D2DB2|nr:MULTISPECIES: aldolase/citrate lyase family protein [unclassified Roseitalea]
MTDQPYSASSKAPVAMRPSRVLRRIRDGRVARCLKLNTTDPRVTEIFAQAGADALWLCMEHVATTWEQAENQVRAAKLYGTDTILRVARGSYSDYVRGLEIDAAGLMVPHVMDADDARAVRDMTKFAPLGRRAVDGGNADALYAQLGLTDYLDQANRERFVFCQIEDPEALDHMEAIADIDGVDGLFFGPGDLSVAMGIPGAINDPAIEAARRNLAATARRHGKIAATVCAPDRIGEMVDMGYNFLSVGADVIALGQYAERTLATFGDL